MFREQLELHGTVECWVYGARLRVHFSRCFCDALQGAKDPWALSHGFGGDDEVRS